MVDPLAREGKPVIAFILEQIHDPNWGAIALVVTVAFAAVCLLWQACTGYVGEDEEQRHPVKLQQDFQQGFGDE